MPKKSSIEIKRQCTCKGLWIVQQKYGIAVITLASFATKRQAEAYAKKWMEEYKIVHNEDT